MPDLGLGWVKQWYLTSKQCSCKQIQSGPRLLVSLFAPGPPLGRVPSRRSAQMPSEGGPDAHLPLLPIRYAAAVSQLQQ